MIQNAVFIISLTLMGSVLAFFSFVAIYASTEASAYSKIQERAYSIRTKLFWVLVVVSVIAIIITTLDLPYAATRGDLIGVDKQIDVTGGQWYWKLSDNKANIGETIVFNVTSADVNHGLGVYDDEMRLIGQTQAMPGYSNALKLSFQKSGQYKLVCLEYCGIAHHAMISNFEVVDQNSKNNSQ